MKSFFKTIILVCLTALALVDSSCKKETEENSGTSNIVIGPSVVSSITTKSATISTEPIQAGMTEITDHGYCWALVQNPDIKMNHHSLGKPSGYFTFILTELLPGQKYYVRAYCVERNNLVYGGQIEFTTNPVVLPTVSTDSVTNISSHFATCGGNVSSDGGGDVTYRGVCWSFDPNPTTINDHTFEGTGSGTFISQFSSLSPNKTYYMRAYAVNSAGTAYGNQMQFTTPSPGWGNYIYDDGIAENGLTFLSGYTGYMGNAFPEVSDQGNIRSVTAFFIYNNYSQNRPIHFVFFDQTRNILGQTNDFIPPDNDWINITGLNIHFTGKFYVMLAWTTLTYESNLLGIDLNGMNSSLDLAWVSDGTNWEKVSTALNFPKGVFLMRVTAELTKSNGKKQIVELGPKGQAENKGTINLSTIKILKKN